MRSPSLTLFEVACSETSQKDFANILHLVHTDLGSLVSTQLKMIWNFAISALFASLR